MRNTEQVAVADLQSENPLVSSVSYKKVNVSTGDFLIAKDGAAAMKDVFSGDLADPGRDRFLELRSFGPFQPQTSKIPIVLMDITLGFVLFSLGNFFLFPTGVLGL